MDGFYIFQIKETESLLQKIHSFFQGIQKTGLQMRKRDLQRNAGKSGSCSHVYYTFNLLHIQSLHTGQAVQEMLYQNLLKICYPGEIHYFVFFYKKFIKIRKLFFLNIIQRNVKLRAALFQYT